MCLLIPFVEMFWDSEQQQILWYFYFFISHVRAWCWKNPISGLSMIQGCSKFPVLRLPFYDYSCSSFFVLRFSWSACSILYQQDIVHDHPCFESWTTCNIHAVRYHRYHWADSSYLLPRCGSVDQSTTIAVPNVNQESPSLNVCSCFFPAFVWLSFVFSFQSDAYLVGVSSWAYVSSSVVWHLVYKGRWNNVFILRHKPTLLSTKVCSPPLHKIYYCVNVSEIDHNPLKFFS